MISVSYVQTMSRYNSWQNRNIYDASARLSDAQRKEDRGAFFRSIHATLNHLLWADQMWLMRFGAAPQPAARSITEGLAQFEDWSALTAERTRFDAHIESWADKLEPEKLQGDLVWFSGAMGREMSTPKALVITHIFNHQTHHRGQVHALLTGFGVKPDITDLPFGPPLFAG
ncbi:DinB family protein [Hyphomicrobium sp.]|jgi:uncharacterized damage-inducible protein DinB|uniref:DinB family protein n=1 Tax=Hyphomicrobium sp. TaxID=82 RepID=UPI002C8C7DF6|nr:DinB family protein [Hyphomicrobium sp.]HVZ06132.1 DinB family protein [Hyphomicrobium sp.]